MVVALSSWWVAGWAIGVAVVAVAAVLLVTVIGLGRRIASQADDITQALNGAREHTTRTNLAIDRITRGLHAVRGGRPR